MCVPLPHEQDTNSADTAYEIVCLRILELCNGRLTCLRLAERPLSTQLRRPAALDE